MFREILTKAIIAKGEKKIEDEREIAVEESISRTLGCWVINHHYRIFHSNQKLYIEGDYEVYIWYGYDEDTHCTLVNRTYPFKEEIPFTFTDEKTLLNDQSELKCYVLKQPTCTALTFTDQTLKFKVERKYAADIIGETKLTIRVNDVSIDKMIDTEYIKEKK